MRRGHTNRERKGNLQLIRDLVLRFPVGCACFRADISKAGRIEDYWIVAVNSRFEQISGYTYEQLMGKRITEVFQAMKPDALQHILALGDQAYYNESKATEFHMSVFNRAYRVSFLYISSNLMLGIYQDVLPYTYRKLYKHTIPCDLIIRSISDRMAKFSEQTGDIKRHHLAVWEGEVNSILDGASPVKLFPAEHSLFDQEDMVFRDALTGMYDRIFGLSALNMYISRGVIPISIVLGDINGLSRVNEKRGYEAGDDMLVCVAHTIRRQCRAEDVIARWGNDEFLILLPYTTGEETQKVIKRLQEALIGQCTDAGHNFITFGYASADHEPRSAQALIHEAEKWVYRKKLLVNESYRSGIIRLLLSTLHENSPDTQEHSDRMTQLCQEIAMRLKLSSEETNDLVLLSLLHDIGKIGIRQEILNKPGPLTPTERLEIELHPEIGFRIAQNIPELAQVARYILAHHEHWDGKGYPNGLHGEEIPLASRMVAVVDAFDVMVSGRPYRAARSKDEALEELMRCSGTQFDPEIVEILAEIIDMEAENNEPDTEPTAI